MGSKTQFDVKIDNFWGFLAKIGYLVPILTSKTDAMTHFHELSHRKCALRHIGEILELRKLDFRGLKDQFDVKKAHFWRLISKIGLFEAYFVFKTNPGSIFTKYFIGTVP